MHFSHTGPLSIDAIERKSSHGDVLSEITVFGKELVFKCRGLNEEEDSFYKYVSRVYLGLENPSVTKEEFLKMIKYSIEKKVSITEYILSKKKKQEHVILPGQKKIYEKIFALGLNGLPIDDFLEYQKIDKLKVNVAAPIIENIQKSNEQMVNVKDIYSNMFQQRLNIGTKCKEKNLQKKKIRSI